PSVRQLGRIQGAEEASYHTLRGLVELVELDDDADLFRHSWASDDEGESDDEDESEESGDEDLRALWGTSLKDGHSDYGSFGTITAQICSRIVPRLSLALCTNTVRFDVVPSVEGKGDSVCGILTAVEKVRRGELAGLIERFRGLVGNNPTSGRDTPGPSQLESSLPNFKFPLPSMAQNLLPIRILFHSAFVLVYLPTILLAFLLDGDWTGLVSLSAIAGLGIFATLKVNQMAFLSIDIFVAVCLPGCLWPMIVGGIMGIVDIQGGRYVTYLGNIGFPLELTATVTLLGLSTFYVLYLAITSIIDKVGGNAFWPRYPDQPALSSSGPRRKVFLGPRRTATERAAVTDQCASYIFQRSVFRKHAFEPTGWAVLRGIIAVYCCVGLLVFTAYEGYSEGDTYANGGILVQESVLANLTVSRWSGYPSLIQNVTDSSSQFWTENVSADYEINGYPFIDNNDFNVSWTGDVTLDIWATVSSINGSTDSIPALYSPGFPLFPFKEYVITLTIISYEMNGFSWLFLEPQIHSVVDRLVLFVKAISEIGGVYAFMDGAFAFMFGRTMLAILFGTRAISPFGLLGIITRGRFRRLINEQYPYLQEDIERGGMAAYISEVAIDPGLVRSSESIHRRSRVATSSQGSHTERDAGVTGIIHLRSMEPSR
ncbi:hypothetical protein FIBSPDRAFT_905770, partial [Athelia psychrophila]